MGSAASSLGKKSSAAYSVGSGPNRDKGEAEQQEPGGADGNDEPQHEPEQLGPGSGQEPEPEPEPHELWEQPEAVSLERRAGWMDVEVPPLEKDLDPEWVTYWFVLLDDVLQVFDIDPAEKKKKKAKKDKLNPPKFEFALTDFEIENISIAAMPVGRGNAFALRKRAAAAEQARAAMLDDAFTAGASGSSASKQKGKTGHDKKAKEEKKDTAGNTDDRGETGGGAGGDKTGKRRRKHRSAAKKHRPSEKEVPHETHDKLEVHASEKLSKAAASKAKEREKADTKKKERTEKAKAKQAALQQKLTDAGLEIPVEIPTELRIDPGSASEYMWWCRALYEGSAHVPELVERRIRQMYSEEEQQRADVTRRVWRNHLVRMSRCIPRCVFQIHIEESEEVEPFNEPKIQVFDGAIAQIEISGVSKMVTNPNLQRAHSELYGKILGCIALHGGDVVSMTGDCLVVLWGLPRWARLQVEKLTRDVLRACQCMVALRSQTIESANASSTFKMRCAVSAGAVSALWVGGYEHRRHFMLKGTPLVQLRKAIAEADWGEIVLTAEAHRLSEEGVAADFSSATQGALLKDIVQLTEDGTATAMIPLEPLNTVTENLQMMKEIAAMHVQRNELLVSLNQIEQEDTGFEIENPATGEVKLSFADNLDALRDFNAVYKKIDNCISELAKSC
jgi:hypothetical protein